MTNTKGGSIKKIPFLKGEVVLLTVDSLATGGAGVSRYEGFVIFTPFTCPGDDVLVRIMHIKKNFAEAELVSVEKPALERVSPQCAVFQKCGGCTWQHISYKEQLRQKQKILASSLNKKLFFSSSFIKDIIPSPKQWKYRNRIQLKVNQKGDYGFYGKKSHDLVPVKNCPISDPILFQGLETIISKLSKGAARNSSRAWFFKKHPHQEVEVYLSEDQKNQYIINGSKLNTDKKAFAQVNEWVNKILIQDVLKYLKKYLLPSDVVYDLYCGHGNFTFPIRKTLKPAKTIGVELNLTSIDRAKKEVLQSKLSGLDFFAQDVQVFLKQCTELSGPVLLDPPRLGCNKEVLFSLKRLKPSIILYISCNPQTLARDLEILIGDNCLYEVVLVQAYDMFPQTDHVESLVVLKLKP